MGSATWLTWVLLAASVPTPAPTPLQTLASATSESGALRVEVLSAAPRLKHGMQAVRLRVTQTSTGKPAEVSRVEIRPWMPAMGHGVDDAPTIRQVAPGEFEVSQLDLFMPGAWELRLTLVGKVEDHAVVALTLH